MGKTWFITGSSRGFGRALVQAALDAGDRVVATARRPEQLAEVAEASGGRVLPVALDVTDPGAVNEAIRVPVASSGAPFRDGGCVLAASGATGTPLRQA